MLKKFYIKNSKKKKKKKNLEGHLNNAKNSTTYISYTVSEQNKQPNRSLKTYHLKPIIILVIK